MSARRDPRGHPSCGKGGESASMFGRHGTLWQILIATIGLAIVAVVLIGPRAHDRTQMVSQPTAIVGANRPTKELPIAPALG